jgi:hypothetical protein
MNILADDNRWFRNNPKRSYRCRLATSSELDAVRELGVLDRKVLADGCFIHCLIRRNCLTGNIETLAVVLPPMERDEEACRQAWFRAELLGQGAMQ